MSNGVLHLMLVYSIDFKRYLRGQGSVTVAEGFDQRVCLRLLKHLGIGHADAPQVLSLEPEIPAAHADAIGRDEELADR
jgi:hypothetical protein